MDHMKNDARAIDLRQRELIVAYLSYALDDVRAVSAAGLQLLQLTIAAITEETAVERSAPVAPIASCH